MAIMYFPKASNLGLRDSFNPSYEQLTIANMPNVIFYFDAVSGLNAASSSGLMITCSWAQSASVTILYASNSLSASYSETASFAMNGGGGGGGGGTGVNSSSFSTIDTGSARWITASFWNPEQIVFITTASLYNFTCSNVPTSSQVAWTSLFISNTALATCSLSFPSSWVFMGYAPSALSSSRNAILTLKSYGGNPVVAAFAVQY